MSVDDVFQIIEMTMYRPTGHSYALIWYWKMHRKAQNVDKITPLQKDHTLLTLLFNFIFFSYKVDIRPSNCGKIFEKYMMPREQIQMTLFPLISSQLVP